MSIAKGGAPGEVLGDREILLGEAPAGARDRERERPEHVAVAGERRDDGRAHAEDARHRDELLVGRLLLGEPAGNVLDQLRATGGERTRDPARGLCPDGPALVHAPGEPRHRRIGVGNADVADLAVVEHVDRAPVGEPRDGELHELAERVLHVERLGQRDTGIGEERERLLALAVLGEIEERRDGRDDLAGGVAHRLGRQRDDAGRAVRADHVDLGVGRRLAGERAVDELRVGPGDRVLGRAGAEQLLGTLIREQQLAGGGLRDDHAERQLAHERREPLALAVGLLIERGVVERERDAAGDLRGELRRVLVRQRTRLPAERQCAERAPADVQGHREHRADADGLHRDPVFGTPVGVVGQRLGRLHELRLAGPDRDRHGRLAPEGGRIPLHDARRSLHLGIRVDDDEPAHGVTLDEVDDALIGQLRDDEIGERAQRGVGLERARELLADRGEQTERAAAAPLRVVDTRARSSAYAHCSPSVVAKARSSSPKTWPRAKRKPSAPSVRSPARNGTDAVGAPLPPLSGKRPSRALVEKDRRAELDGLADRRRAREREAAPVGDLGLLEAVRGDELDRRVVGDSAARPCRRRRPAARGPRRVPPRRPPRP